MIAYQTKTNGDQVTIENSKGGSVTDTNVERLLDFLFEPGDDFRCFWDLDDALAPILRKLPQKNLNDLSDRRRTWTTHGITYHQGKKRRGASLTIARDNKKTQYYHLSQFFPSCEGPSDLSELAAMGDSLLSELKSIGITPTRLSSAPALFDTAIDRLPLPDFTHLPNEVGQLAWDAAGCRWTEAFQLGHWPDDCFDYDMRSAYVATAATLCDTRYGRWVNQTERPSGAVYGLSRGLVNITGNISPIVFRDEYGRLFNPKGQFPVTLCLQELDALAELGLGTFEPYLDESWWWIPTRAPVRPLQNFVHRLYGFRAKSPVLNDAIKLGLSGCCYGIFLQELSGGELGKHFFPVWGHIIEAETRLAVMRFLRKHNALDSLISVATDGCLLSSPVSLPDNERPLPGSWRLDATGPALVLSSGSVFFGSKRPHQLHYPEALRLIQETPKADAWTTTVKRRVTLYDVAGGPDELDPTDLMSADDLGLVKDVRATIRLKIFDHDRDFPTLPFTGEALLNKRYPSQALDARDILKAPAARQK